MATPTAPAAPSVPAAPVANQKNAANPPQNSQNNAAAAPTPTPQEIRKMKLKLDGQEVELTETEVIAYAQQGKVAQARFQEAAKVRREAEDILKYAQENPEEFFKKTGKNAREWAEKFLLEQLQHEAMSPEQKKAKDNEDKLRKYEDDEKRKKAKEMKDHEDALTTSERTRLDQLFTKALFESGLPRTKFTVKRMAELQLLNIKNKYELPADALAKLVREDYEAEQKALLGGLEGDQLLDFLGPEIVKKFSKAQIAKLKARGVQPSAGGQRQPPSRKEDETLTWRELQKRNRRPV